MLPGPSATSAGPKRFGANGRSLYTDPFAEIQRKKESETLQNVPSVLLPPPPVIGDHSEQAAFPVEGTASPNSWQSSARHSNAGELFVVETSEIENSEAPFIEQPTELYIDDNLGDRGSTDEATYGSDEGPPPVLVLEETVPQLPATRIDLPPHEVGSPALSTFALQQTPRSALRGVEISAIDQVDQIAGGFDEEVSPEISILGHPVGPPHVFPSEGRTSLVGGTLYETLTSVKEDHSSDQVLAIKRVIAQCVDLSLILKEDRAFFCETIEAVSFHEGPLRDAAQEAVTVLVDLLENEEDPKTASSALGALWNLTSSSATDNIFEDDQLVHVSRKTMLAFPESPDVQGNATGVLVNLSAAEDVSIKKKLLHLGCIEAIVSAVTRHSANSLVLEHACQLLSILAANRELKTHLNSEHIRTVLDIASKSRDPSVKRWTAWLAKLAL